MAVKITNTLTGQKEAFEPLEPGRVRMYVCGPTVYSEAHIGHAMSAIIFDVIRRYLEYAGHEVTFVQNFTDIDDKIIQRAATLGIPPQELAEKLIRDWISETAALNIKPATIYPRATQEIDVIQEIIQGLIESGHAYAVDGDVFYRVLSFPGYGKLSKRQIDEMLAGARVEVDQRKEHPMDFVLWKAAKPGEPTWDSPWGPGRPGWHIECSAMSMKLLGQTLDIHGGGLDLQFPHHENELAQSECYTGVPFVRYWLHNGLMKTGQDKMSKSKGNEIVVSELLKTHDAETLRFLLLSSHYRSPIEYSEDRLRELRRALEGFYAYFARYERTTGESFYDLPTAGEASGAAGPHGDFHAEVAGHRREFLEAMDDDFNTAGAIGTLYDLLTTLNRFTDQHRLEAAAAAGQSDGSAAEALREGTRELRRLGALLGLFWEAPRRLARAGGQLFDRVRSLLEELSPERARAIPAEVGEAGLERVMAELIALRAEARKAKDFARADLVRQRLSALGVVLEDRPGGTGWRVS